MPRQLRKPFFWKARNAWYIKDQHRKNKFLAFDRAKAHEIWALTLAADPAVAVRLGALVKSVFTAYLDWAEKEHQPKTVVRSKYYLDLFAAAHPGLMVADLKPFHVTDWLKGYRQGWGDSSKRAAIATLKQALNWADGEGRISGNPLAKMKKPAIVKREQLIERDLHVAMVVKSKPAFRSVLIALCHSGARPGTIGDLNRKDVSKEIDRWIVPKHKQVKKTKKPLVVHLSPCLSTLTRIHLHFAPKERRGKEDPVFANGYKKRWTTNAIRCRIRRLKEVDGLEIPDDICAYGYRHTYITNAILAGVDVAVVAELVGHKDLNMISRHYGHLAGAASHLQAAAKKAVQR